jgi:hypothetical protein
LRKKLQVSLVTLSQCLMHSGRSQGKLLEFWTQLDPNP